ncbi:MAG: Splicing factor [Piccolia ochrophora]|nr:MAG: Splicing factor [Piccolia ochrophora]
MDINKLLSPQDSPVDEVPDNKLAAGSLRRTHSSSLTPKSTASPKLPGPLPPPALPHGAVVHAQQKVPSPNTISPGTGVAVSATSTPPADARPGSSRQGSTPGMDTLADLASMQHHQHAARTNANGLRSSDVYDTNQLQSPPGFAALHTLPNTRPIARSSVDLIMTDAPAQKPVPRTYRASSLSESDLQVVAQLVTYLAENPYAFESHMQLLGLLRRGFLAHINGVGSEASSPDPRTYELLQDLRQARQAMEARFPVGEEVWANWISDEMLLAGSLEECVTVMELCLKAVDEEFGSARLWLLYADWVTSLYRKSHSKAAPESDTEVEQQRDLPWGEKDVAVGAEMFTREVMMEVWAQGARATRLRLSDSHTVWDRYARLILDDLANDKSQQKINQVKSFFEERLQTPHATWDETFQLFSNYMTSYDNASYEQVMATTSKRAADAKSSYASREVFEIKVTRAIDSGDRDQEWSAFAEYLDWEIAQLRKKKGKELLCNALYERAVLRFSTDASLWEDYVFFLIERVSSGTSNLPVLPVLQRATRHCPWSGTLWAQYLLTSEREEQPFQEIEEVKHKATSTGLMDVGGMEEVLKVQAAWCEYLNRRAFHEKATDEEADVAEVGIRSALESLKELGEKKYGKEYKGDPTYRLERIYIQYLSRSGLWDRARREVWQMLVPTKGDSHEFWLRWYDWEMIWWNRTESSDPGNEALTTPSAAAAVLRQAVGRQKLDWPEKVLEAYMNHVEDYENVEELQKAALLVRKISKAVAKRRLKEANEMTRQRQEEQQQQQEQQEVALGEQHPSANGVSAGDDIHSSGKRKRGPEDDASGKDVIKKSRPDDQQLSATSLLKRDRENTTVIARNLPVDATEIKVRQYFRDCGTIHSLNVMPEEDGASATATIEFDAKEDVLAAQTRDMKSFEGNTLEIQIGTGSTIFATNFPPTADETYIRNLFKDCGDVVDIRFPSLKYNTHRRFCYVQFKSSSQAEEATKLEGKNFGGRLKLVAKISDPGHKHNRSGAMYEGREVYVSNVDWTATEDELDQMFSKYGKVEKIRVPTNVAGKSKGIAFVVFTSKDEAQAALDMNLTKFKSRVLSVSLSTSNPSKRTATTIVKATSPSSNNSTPVPRDSPHDDTKPVSSELQTSKPSRDEIRSRTIALLKLPDTVNDARVRALMEPYGILTKIVLRPDHQGAIVEFSDTQAAGKASMGVDGHEVIPGRKIQVGTVEEMLREVAEYRKDRIDAASAGKKSAKDTKKPSGLAMQHSGPIQRPSQQTARRGGKGGLGIKRGGVGLSSSRAMAPGTQIAGGPPTGDPHDGTTIGGSNTTTNGQFQSPPLHSQQTAPRTNADFRAQFLNASKG